MNSYYLSTFCFAYVLDYNFFCFIIKGVEKKYWNGIVNDVQIYIYDEDIKISRTTNVPVNYTSYVLKDLNIGSNYSIRLAICTKGGCKKSNLTEIFIDVPGVANPS